MNTDIKNAGLTRGFTLVQVSIILTVAALAMVAALPLSKTTLNANNVSVARMNTVLQALRQYEAANGVLPCPADASLAMGNANYGVAAANPGYYGGSGLLNTCTGGTPAANFVDTTNHVAVGMIPVRAIGLSNDYALDGYGRYITYAVDAYATGNSNGIVAGVTVWSVPLESLMGQILIDDNGVINRTVVALISHGADGHGAWMPLNATSGTGVRLNAGSSDTDQLVNAHLLSTGTFPNPTTSSLVNDSLSHSATFVKKPPTSTFDDLVVYKNPLWNINQQPLSIVNMISVSPPPNGAYFAGEYVNIRSTVPILNNTLLDLDISTNQSYGGYLTGSWWLAIANGGYIPETSTLGFSINSVDSSLGYSAIAHTNAKPIYFTLDNGPNVLNGTGSQSVSSTAGFRVSAPPGIAVDTSTNCNSGPCINVVDSLNNRVTQWAVSTTPLTSPPTYVRSFGILGTTVNTGTFTNPSGIAVDSNNNLYIVDTNNNRVEKWSGSPPTYTPGNYVGSYGNNSGSTSNPTQFNYPTGIAIDASTHCNSGPCLWIADSNNGRIVSCNINGTFASTCTAYVASGMQYPTGMAVDSAYNVYVSSGENWNYVFQKFNGSFSTVGLLAAASYANGNLVFPTGIATYNTGSNNIWVADGTNNRVEVFNTSGAWQFTIGGGGVCVTGSCTITSYPTAPTVNSPSTLPTANSCYTNSYNICQVSLFCGCTASNNSSYFNNPSGIAIDNSTHCSGGPCVYVVDSNNSRVQMFNTSGTYINQFGTYGTGSSQFNF